VIVTLRGEIGVPSGVVVAGGIAGLMLAAAALWRITRTLTVARQMIAEVAIEIDMQPIPARFEWWRSRSAARPITPGSGESELVDV
jgi:hypothetical protein